MLPMGRLLILLVFTFIPLVAGLLMGTTATEELYLASLIRESPKLIPCVELAQGQPPSQANITLTGYQIQWTGVTEVGKGDKNAATYQTYVPIGPATPADEPRAAESCVFVILGGQPTREEIQLKIGQHKLTGILWQRGGFGENVDRLLLQENPSLVLSRCWHLLQDRKIVTVEQGQLLLIASVGCVTLAFVVAFAARGYRSTVGSFDPLIIFLFTMPVLGVLYYLARGFHLARDRAPLAATLLLFLPGMVLLGVAWAQWQHAEPPVPGGSTKTYIIAFLDRLITRVQKTCNSRPTEWPGRFDSILTNTSALRSPLGFAGSALT